MEWNKYTLETTTDATDFVSGVLMELGISGVEIKDNIPLSEEDKKAMFIDYVPEPVPDDGTAYVSFYIEKENEDREAELLDELKSRLFDAKDFLDVGSGMITKETTGDEDWVNNWKQFFKPFEVGSFYIKPVWEQCGKKSDMKVIEIDPGAAFGTGKHETTRMCIEQLDKYINSGMSVFDIGCGSGILSIAAKKLGAGNILMTDIDVAAVKVSKENLNVNGIPTDGVEIMRGDLLTDKEIQDNIGGRKFDVVVANILADVIIPLSAVVHEYMKPGAVFISSGIIYMKEEEVKDAIEANGELELIEVIRQGDWRCITARRKQ